MGFFGDMLSRPKSSERNSPPRTTLAISDRIRNVLGIRQLESMPTQAARAFRMATDPKSDANDFIGVIESDEVLSARVVRIANSVYFFRGAQATDIEKAIANIGLEEIRCILSATMLKSLLAVKHSAREQLWSNSVATGICARLLSAKANIPSGEAFLCGILHDVGKLAMVRYGGRQYDRVLTLAGQGEKSFVEAEEEVFELNHVEVGKWLAEEWNLPSPVVRTIAFHHDPLPAPGNKLLNHAQLIQISDILAHASGIGHPPPFRGFQQRNRELLPKAWALLHISASEGENICKTFEAQFEREYGLYQLEQR